MRNHDAMLLIVKPLAQDTFDPKTLEMRNLLQRVLLWVIGFALVIGLSIIGFRQLQASDPYIHKVLSLRGDSSRGEAIFRMNCAVCHGIEATGEVGPNLRGVSDRKSKISLIKQVTSGQTPPMPQFQPNPQDMADLLHYLEGL